VDERGERILDVAIVGGGIAGLSLAALLSDKYSVAVFEKSKILGGRARVVERDGFILDYGIHTCRFADEGVVAELFSKLGIPIEFHSSNAIVYSNGFYRVPKGAIGFLTTKLVPFRARLTLLRLMIKLLRLNPRDVVDVTVHEFIKDITEREDIYRLVSALIGSGIVCPDMKKASLCEAVTFAQKAVKSKYTGGYPVGGWKYIIDSLKKKIVENGSEIRLNSEVKKVEVNGNVAEGIVVGDEFIDARVVVIAFPLQRICGIVDRRLLPESFVEKVESLEPTSGISIDLALKEKVSNIDSVILTLQPVIMGHFTSNIYTETAPEGKQLATFYYPLPYEKMDDRSYLDRKLEEMREMLEEMFPGILDKTEWERVLYLKVVDGAIPKPGQTYFERPDYLCPTIENLFFVGDTTRAEGNGGDIAFRSALECAEKIEKYLEKFKY
jgi:phytoene dehydrogenase-like protein